MGNFAKAATAGRFHFVRRRTTAFAPVLCVSLMAQIAWATSSQADDLSDCNSNDVKRIMSGCTAVIDEGNLSGPTLAIAYSRRSDAHIAQSKFDEAIADRNKARDLDPDNQAYARRHLEAREARGDARLAAGEFRGAIEDYTVVHDGSSASAELLQKRSDAYLALRKTEEAVADLRAALKLVEEKSAIQARIVRVYELLAVESRKAKDLTKAIAYFRAGIEELDSLDLSCSGAAGADGQPSGDVCGLRAQLNRRLISALLDRGLARLASSRPAWASKDFKAALTLDPANGRTHLLGGLSEEQAGNFRAAEAHFRFVLDKDPGNKEAREGIARLGRRETNLAKLIQIELKRLGCDPGPVDGDWGRQSIAALQRFNQHTGRDLNATVPRQATRIILSGHENRACPDLKPVFISALGISVRTADDGVGVLVTKVQSGSRAGRAGVKTGMVITNITTVWPLAFSQTNRPQDLEDRALSILSGKEKDRRMTVTTKGGAGIFIDP